MRSTASPDTGSFTPLRRSAASTAARSMYSHAHGTIRALKISVTARAADTPRPRTAPRASARTRASAGVSASPRSPQPASPRSRRAAASGCTPATFFISFPPVRSDFPDGITASSPVTQSFVTPYLSARGPRVVRDVPPIVHDPRLAGSGP